MARNPAFPDQRTGSLSIRELDDGRVLVHDFAGVDLHSVLALIDLRFSDLFPDQGINGNALRPIRQAHSALVALKALHRESMIVVFAADAIVRGSTPTDADTERLVLASSRIREALEVCQ